MAYTVQSLITAAMRINTVYGSGEIPTPNELTDGLNVLNDLIETLNVRGLGAFNIAEINKALTASDQSYTIGTGGDINQQRPIRIASAYVRSGTTDYPIGIIGPEAWGRIQNKSTTGIPTHMYYEASWPLGTINVWPAPTASLTLYMQVYPQLATYSAQTDTISLPPGYANGIKMMLAQLLGPEYGKQVPPAVAQAAADFIGGLEKANAKQPMSRMPSGIPPSSPQAGSGSNPIIG